MRIKTIELAWFRGAAHAVALEPNCKSMVVYGLNGSGKSSFVDAVEYVLNGGKIRHLAHEYSGKHQEKGIPNTHTPPGRKTELRIRFKSHSELKIEIKKDGFSMDSSGEAVAMDRWDYRRTVLRQDEVAAFIHDTKGGKYSALLPLLGLHPMEVTAENVRRLSKAVEQQSKLNEIKGALKQVETKRKEMFGTDNEAEILKKIELLHVKYCGDNAATKDPSSRCDQLENALDSRIARFAADYKRYLALQGAATLNLKGCVDAVRAASLKLAGTVEPLIAEKLEVLQSTALLVDKLKREEQVNCPACGRSITVDALQAHVKAEHERLEEIIDVFGMRKAAIGTLCDAVKSLKSTLGNVDIKSWRDELAEGPLAENLAYLVALNAEALRTSCGNDDLKELEDKLLPLIDAAAFESKEAPPDVRQLSIDKQAVATAKAGIAANEQAAETARAEALVSFINSLEHGIREEIKLRSKRVIYAISADIQAMWAILHPGDAIEDLRLYLPKDADKAIDIGLKFHGKELDSPRLTLSEGYRNSLGLCIFLAMAKRETDKDRPLFLDDVVVSLDRNHRGMVVELLQKEFGGRQVIIMTHDREWYTELRQQLGDTTWTFRALLPYETPSIGIRWSHRTTTFDDAQAHLKERPDSAGNDARKIMDVELALIAERLKIRLPYLRADKNDRRTAHEFLERLIADGRHCFQKRVGGDYAPCADVIEVFDKADRLLVSWANRGSHNFDVVRSEAIKLVNACEKALESFKCPTCGKGVWFAEAEASRWVQCQCGEIRWRYGKG